MKGLSASEQEIMEAYDLTRTVPTLSIAMMGVTFFALIIVTAMFYVWVRHGYPNGRKGVFAGMASYFLICSCFLGMIYSGEQTIYNSLANADMVEGQKQALTHVSQVVFIMFECAILVILLFFIFNKFVYVPSEYNYGNILMFSIGFSLVDTLNWLVSTGVQWLYGTSINGMGLETFVNNLEKEEEKLNFLESVQRLLDNGPFYYFLMFVERLIFIAFVVCLITLMYQVLRQIKPTKFLVVIWGLYVMYYIPSVLKFFNIITSDTVLIALAAVYVAGVAVYSQKVFSKCMPYDWQQYRALQKEGIYRVVFMKTGSNKDNGPKKSGPNKKVATVNRGSISKNAHINSNKE